MDKFTASNGTAFETLEPGNPDGQIRATREVEGAYSRWTIDSAERVALREFFAHERDVELGRWRSGRDSDWTAVEDGEFIRFRHDDGIQEYTAHRDVLGRKGLIGGVLEALCDEYHAAHKPRPWHDAKPGEVWVVTAYEGPIAMTVFESDFDGLRFRQNDHDGTIWALDTPVITSARRIFPEVSDD